MDQTRRHVFVSHSSHDLRLATELAASLAAEGVEPWLSEIGIRPGENYADAITRAIRAASAVAVILSEQAMRSEHVKREISLAITTKQPLLPVTLPGVRVDSAALDTEWVYWLTITQTLPWTSASEVARSIADRVGLAAPVRSSSRAPAEGRIAVAGRWLKVTESGRAFVVDLHPDGTLKERSAAPGTSAEEWFGVWEALNPGEATGFLRTRIGDYEALVQLGSRNQLSGVEHEEGQAYSQAWYRLA